MISSCVKEYGGAPTLFINGEPQVAMAYITYFGNHGRFRAFSEAGYRLFSTPVYFGDQGINVVTGIAPFEPGIFSEKGKADFSIFDRQIRHLLDKVPDALIFPRLNLSMPAWWERENPAECNDSGFGDAPRRSCFSSVKWREDTRMFLRRFLEYAEQSPYRDRLFGYQLADGNTEEYFSYDQTGSIGPAARKGYEQWPGNDRTEASFRRYLSFAAADALRCFAATAKECTGRRLVIGSFYGYTFEVPFWQSNHHALRHILECADIDFLCSPASYTTRCEPGVDWPCMVPLDSIKLHGKLYFAEYDTRTCCTRSLAETHPGACRPGTYDSPLWLGAETEEESIHLLRMNFVRQIAAHCGSWWFDMWGGWFDTPGMMAELAAFRRFADRFLEDRERESVAECAAWIDEESFSVMDGKDRCCREGRIAIGQSGVPFDFYEIGDFDRAIERYRVALFFAPAVTPAVERAKRKCEAHSVPWLEISSGGRIDADAVRMFCTSHDAHCYCSGGDAIHVSKSMIAIHAASDGEKTLRLKETRQITPLSGEGGCFRGKIIRRTMKQGETLLFRLDP